MKKKGIKKSGTTTDDLAIMVQRGFADQARDLKEFKEEMRDFKKDMIEFKDEMDEFKTRAESTLFNIDSKLQTVDERLNEIDKILGPLVHVVGGMKVNSRDHELRISRLEHRLGLSKK